MRVVFEVAFRFVLAVNIKVQKNVGQQRGLSEVMQGKMRDVSRGIADMYLADREVF
jgi:hypothetical protein